MDAVVLHDQVSYTHPEWDPAHALPGTPKALATAVRGQTLSTEEGKDFDSLPAISEKEMKRLEHLGAVATDVNSLEAKMAKTGQPAASLRGVPYHVLSSAKEQEAAMKAAVMAGGGVSLQSTKAALSKLDIGDLKIMAKAFGKAEYADSDSKEELISVLTGADGEGQDLEETRENEQLRDEAYIGDRSYGGEAGNVGLNVDSKGNNALTGEKTVGRNASTEEAAPARRKSRAQQDDDKS